MSVVPGGYVIPRKSFAQVAAAANIPTIAKQSSVHNANANSYSQATFSGQNVSAVARTTGAAENNPCKADELRGLAQTPGSELGHVFQLNGLLKAVTLDESQLPNSALDGPSRKDTSDTKSVASRTTLTLDEKESLRPDDSASMQAAAEEDALSPAGSVVAGLRPASDPDARAFRDQLHEIDRTGNTGLLAQVVPPPQEPLLSEQRNGGITYPTPPLLNDYQPLVVTSAVPSRGPPVGLVIPPDEKLLEALQSPKDRLFVLKIEQDMIDFVRDSKEQYLQLPQTNSFYRMLSHKLADYYLLGHLIDDSMTSVRIYRTPHCRLPPPLIGPDPTSNGSLLPTAAPTRKIMRRGIREYSERNQSTVKTVAVSPLSPSIATSETGGGSGSDEDPNILKDKATLTREERESRYREARARIFRDFKDEGPEIAEGSSTKNSKEISRSSSTSGTKKNKKSHKPKDDGFEARSAYSQYSAQPFTPNNYAQPVQDSSTYNSFANFVVPTQYPQMSPPFQGGMQAGIFAQPSFSSHDLPGLHQWPGHQMSHQFEGTHDVSHPGPYTYEMYGSSSSIPQGHQAFPSPNTAAQATPKTSSSSLAGYNQAFQPLPDYNAWSQMTYPNSYAMSNFSYGEDNGLAPGHHAGQMIYPYTAAAHHNGYAIQDSLYYDYQSSNGGLNRPQFNPRTQDFVPNPGGSALYPTQYSLFAPSMPNSVRFPIVAPVQRQISDTSQIGVYGSPQYFQSSLNDKRNNGHTPSRPSAPNARQPQAAQSSISKWGTPSTLPPKPPPPATSLPFHMPKILDSPQSLPPHPYALRAQTTESPSNTGYR